MKALTLHAEIEEKLELLKAGHNVDVSLSNGILRSSKEIYAWWTDQTSEEPHGYSIFHGIDGTITNFTKKGIVEVLTGKRDVWDGDMPENEEQ